MTPLILIVLSGLVSVYAALDTTNLCRDLLFLDCNVYQAVDKDEEVCADGTTYVNFCEYSQAKCRFPSINIQWIGSCHRFDPTSSTTTTTPATTTRMPTAKPMATTTMMTTTMAPTTTVDPLIAVFCAHKDTIQCTNDLAPICGSDGQVYNNDCTFAKKRCDATGLTIEPLSNCQSGK